jgi:parvulin-like peptidyl-prolyl isomerase
VLTRTTITPWLWLASFALACASPDEQAQLAPEAAPTDAALAQVGQVSISVEHYEQYLGRIPESMRSALTPERYVEALIEEELLVQEAEARDLHRDPAVQRLAEQERRTLVQRLLYQSAGIEAAPPSEHVLRAYFAESPYNRKVRFSLLMVRDAEEIPPLLAQIKAGADFKALSMRHSLDPRILERKADMGYHRWGETMPAYAALTKKAFSMQLGELAGPLQVANGHFLIKLTDVHPVSFEQERETITRLFMREEVGKQLLTYYDTLHVRYDMRYQQGGVDALLTSLASAEITAAGTTVVATYRDGSVDLKQAFAMMLRAAQSKSRAEMLLALRRETGRQVLASLEVVRLGLLDNEEVETGVKRAQRLHIVRRLQEQLLTPEPNVNALRLFYEEHGERYIESAKVEVDRLLANDLEEGRTLIKRLHAGEQVHDERFVHLIYGSSAWQSDNPVSLALRAEPGTAHGPFATDSGYIILRITARHDERQPDLEEVREQVQADWREAQAQKVLKEFAQGLRQRRASEISINQQQLQRLALLK